MYQWFSDRNTEIIEKAMGEIPNRLAERGLDMKMIVQVHDELTFEVAEKDLDAAQAKIVEIMQTSSKIDVPCLWKATQHKNRSNWLQVEQFSSII
ncbi:MAG: DNA polymerase [Pseudomonadota bacterium]|nr:DNA polymerase [Pseudomonadota bacterium]